MTNKEELPVEEGSKQAPEHFYIKITADGPYFVYGNPPIDQEIIMPNAEGSSWVYQKGKHFETSEAPVHLCRCGHSKHKPFCDGSHKHADWDPRETAPHSPLLEDADEIEGPTMVLGDNEKYCAFARFCDARGRIWNLVERAETEEERELVRREAGHCPSGRLVVWDKETEEVFEPPFDFVRSGYRVGVAHCNFQLRGVESEEDEELVRREAEKYGVPWYNKRFDTKGEMERTGESMEMAARRLRYAWFDELSREHGYTVVAIAHHIDDSIETFFINLLRGTGLRGLTGITTHAGKLIRPLMFASRKDILEYAVAQHIPYREDSSNRSTKYLRNKIRLGLVPRIKEISPKFTDLMRQNIGRLTDAQLFINHGIQRIREEVITTENGIDTIHIDRIDRAFPLNFVIFELLNSTYSFKGDVSDALVRALEQNSGTGKRFYSKSHVAYIDRGRIMVTPIPADDPCQVQVEAGAPRCYCGNSVLYFELRDIDDIQGFGVPEHIAQVDADKLKYPLTVRRWQEGDWFIPYGMSGRKKVSDYLIDHKVPLPEKARQFVLLSGDEIVWLVGRRIDDRYRLTAETENVLRITKEII